MYQADRFSSDKRILFWMPSRDESLDSKQRRDENKKTRLVGNESFELEKRAASIRSSLLCHKQMKIRQFDGEDNLVFLFIQLFYLFENSPSNTNVVFKFLPQHEP